MLSKFALAFKTKTIEFFAEEDEDEGIDEATSIDLSPAPELEVITGQRVVVLKPDPPPTRPDANFAALIPSVFAAISSFRAAYLQLQTAHSPLDLDAVAAADHAAVGHLQRISDLKRGLFSNPNPSILEAQVQENQALLRTFETVFNRLQAEIDCKDAEAAQLKQRIKEIEAVNSKLARKVKSDSMPSIEKVEGFLSVGVFDSVLKDCCRSMHRFSKLVIGLMKRSGSDFDCVVDLIYPNVEYLKPGHWRYTILSYIALGMFDGFDSDTFCCESGEIDSDSCNRKRNSLRQFIEHMAVDHLELMRRDPGCGFAKFCEGKYKQLISKCMESSIFGNLDENESLLGSLKPSNPLYHSFVDMASSTWMLHKLACAYEPVVEIFQVGRGKEFSMVFMESVVRTNEYGKVFPAKVGFTVIPGFRIGKTVIQCSVYLVGVKGEDI